MQRSRTLKTGLITLIAGLMLFLIALFQSGRAEGMTATTVGTSGGIPAELVFSSGKGWRFAIVDGKPEPNETKTAMKPGVYQCVRVVGNQAWLPFDIKNADIVTEDGIYFTTDDSRYLNSNTLFLKGDAPQTGPASSMGAITPNASQIVSMSEVLGAFKASSLSELIADASSVDDANVRGFNILANADACAAAGTSPEAIISWYNSHAGQPYSGSVEDAWIVCQQYALCRRVSGGKSFGLTWRALEPTLDISTGNFNTGPDSFAKHVLGNYGKGPNTKRYLAAGALGYWNTALTPYDDTQCMWKEAGTFNGVPIGAVMIGNFYSGVAIYSFADGATGSKIVGNTLVEYTAEPGSDAVGAFNTYGQVYKVKGDEDSSSGGTSSGVPDYIVSGNEFVIWDGGKWVTPTSLAHMFNCEAIDPIIDQYTLWKAETYDCVTSGARTMDDMKNRVFHPSLNLSATWGNIAPKDHYNVKLGSAFGLTAVGGKTDLSAVAEVINGIAGGGSTARGELSQPIEAIYAAAEQAVNDSISRSMSKNYNSLTKSTFAGKNVGYGVELIYKIKPIRSTMYTIILDKGVLDSIDTDVREYNSGTFAYFSPMGCALAAVPNSLAVDPAVVAAAASGATTNEAAAAALFGAVPSVGAPNGGHWSPVPDVVATGSTKDFTGELEGYTLYCIATSPDLPVHEGPLTLPDYMTNSMWDNVCDWLYMQEHHSHWKCLCKRDEWTYIYDNIQSFAEARIFTEADCGHKHEHIPCSGRIGHYWLPGGTGSIPDNEKTWLVEYHDFSEGKEATADNAFNTQYFLKATSSWARVVRNDKHLLHPDWDVVVDTKNINPENYRWDYCFNLCRKFNGDKRTVSAIHPIDNEGYAKNILQFDIGVKPTWKEPASEARNSQAEVAIDNEKIVWRSQWDLWNKVNGPAIHDKQHTGSYVVRTYVPAAPPAVGTVPVDTPFTHTHTEHFVKMDDIVKGFTVNGNAQTTVEYVLEKHVKKYVTKTMPTASNTTHRVHAGEHIASNPYNDDTESNAFRVGMVQAHDDITLSYFPEIIMGGIIPKGHDGDDGIKAADGFNTVHYWIMAEEKRAVHASSIYLYRMKPTGGHNVEGFTYSDSALGATGFAGDESIVNIPMGSDVKVVAQPKGIRLNLYCYSLDIINIDRDSSLNDGNSNYQDIVYSNDNVRTLWGNGDSYTNLFNKFKDWAGRMTDPNLYQADMVLKINNASGEKVYTNFSTTIGNIKKGTYEEGKSWNIKVQHGQLVRGESSDNGVERLFQSIADDYGCSLSEAEALFMESGIWQSIKRAMETEDNSLNTSQKVSGDYPGDTITDECASFFGGQPHWYDESTRTFVIRRFALVNNIFEDIVAEDKIDFNSGATATDSSVHSYGQNGREASNATWYTSIFIKKGKEFNETRTDIGYDPTNISLPVTDSSIANVISPLTNEFRIILDRKEVYGAEFKIPASSTSNFGD